ncbi:MAG: YbbR-like domain-containing protein [Oscillospiraceae bacterium]
MKKLDGRKAVKVALSILVAVCIWLYVGSVDSTEIIARAKDVPVVFIGEEGTLANRGLMVVESSAETVDLKLRARRNVLYDLDTRDLRIIVDLRDITETGSYSLGYTVEYPSNVQKSQITIDSASAYAINVTIGELYKKTVDLKYDITGTVPEGYLLQEPVTTVETLEIHGQQEDVIRVSYAKVSYDVSGCTASVNEMVDFQFYDSANQPLEGVTIYADQAKVPLNIPIYKQKEISLKASLIEVAGLRAGDVVATVLPQRLLIAGESYVVEDLEELLVAEIDLGEISGSVNKTFPLQLPDGVISVDGVTEVTVNITLKSSIDTREFTTSNFSTEHVPDGMTATVLGESLTVTLRGKNLALDKADAADILVIADVAGISAPGRYSVTAVVRYEGEEDLGVIGSYQVTVELRDQEETPQT